MSDPIIRFVSTVTNTGFLQAGDGGGMNGYIGKECTENNCQYAMFFAMEKDAFVY